MPFRVTGPAGQAAVTEQDPAIVHEQDRHIVTEIDLTLNTGCGGQISEHFCTTFCDGHQPGPVLPNLREPMCQPEGDGRGAITNVNAQYPSFVAVRRHPGIGDVSPAVGSALTAEPQENPNHSDDCPDRLDSMVQPFS